MGDRSKVEFQQKAAEPLVVDVKGADGKEWEVRVVLEVSEVYDSGDPADPARFVVVTNVALDAQPKRS